MVVARPSRGAGGGGPAGGSAPGKVARIRIRDATWAVDAQAGFLRKPMITLGAPVRTSQGNEHFSHQGRRKPCPISALPPPNPGAHTPPKGTSRPHHKPTNRPHDPKNTRSPHGRARTDPRTETTNSGHFMMCISDEEGPGEPPPGHRRGELRPTDATPAPRLRRDPRENTRTSSGVDHTSPAALPRTRPRAAPAHRTAAPPHPDSPTPRCEFVCPDLTSSQLVRTLCTDNMCSGLRPPRAARRATPANGYLCATTTGPRCPSTTG